MKKLLCVLLSLVVVVSSCSLFATAAGEVKGDISEYPVIIVPGYSSTNLYYGDSLETGESVWGLDFDYVLERVLARIADIGIGLGMFAFDNAEYITDVLAEEMTALFEKIRCNPDGTSAYELHQDYTDALHKNNAYLIENRTDTKYRQEVEISEEIAQYIGHENIYNFSCDFRMGAESCAKELDAFVQEVKAHSGKDKVNLFAISHGGQVSATYLALYGYKDDVDNAVLTVPAIGGAGIAYDAMMATIEFDEECLLRFIENGTMTEENYNWLVKAQQLGFVDTLLCTLFPKIFPSIGYWGSLWDFIPVGRYEEAKAALLDSEESARLIEISDRFHYEILPSMPEKFAECIENGMNISIVAGTGEHIVTGMDENSDGIITTNASTGATCAPYGQRFGDGYEQINYCNGKDKISPSMEIDASTAYLPDNTWFVDGLFHGMTYKDNYTRVLMMTLLLTDDITSVYSNPDFPQFKYSTNASHTVHAAFDGCDEGILSSEAKTLTVTNVCANSNVRIAAVECDGIDLVFTFDANRTLAPGEIMEVEFEGEIPQVSGKAVNVTVCYAMNTITPIGYRTQTFRIMNGAPVENTEELVDFEDQTVMNGQLDSVLGSLGLREIVSMLYTIISYWVSTIFSF
ncbi:MAG: alpha/beta fold hydrolase [Acutalibacteraceae bacterium]|nr:alpha/beta fold hydrolase [Acutalibacteraceae bacterium]